MGFLKRLFSLGTKKNKKRPPNVRNITQPVEAVAPTNDEEHEAAVRKLLRSTSARFVESAELNYANLPPIPHPINNVIATPASSTVSLDTASSIKRGTYNVTVHRRRRHTSTEFPDANRDLENQKTKSSNLQPVEDSRVLRLRSDPSVASLLELYDDHGRLANDAFSNDEPSQPSVGRAQVRRNGSTLRQLLGVPSVKDGGENSEGDISWAERFLGESDATSIVSSSGVRTPEISQFPEGTSAPEVSIVSEVDLSACTFDNPAVSSMEVEVNDSYEISQDLDASFNNNGPYMSSDPATPQRASQIFGFLTKGKQSKHPIDLDRTLPQLPSCFSSPSDESASDSKWPFTERESFVNMSFNPKHFSAPPIPHNNDTQRIQERPRSSFIEHSSRVRNTLSQEPRSAFSDDSHDFHEQRMMPTTPQPPLIGHPSEGHDAKRNDIRVLMTGPTKVIVTAPTPGTNPTAFVRGPRSLARKTSSGSSKRRRSVLRDVPSNSPTFAGDPFVIVSPKQKTRPERRNSTSSTKSFSRRDYEEREDYISFPKKQRPLSPAPKINLKENQLSLSVKNELPSTPLRSNASSRPYARSLAQQGAFCAPDANLSSELSPVGRQMMSDVRQQRMRAREAERLRIGNRF